VWRSDRGGHRKIYTKIYKKRPILFGLFTVKKEVNGFNEGLYTPEKYDRAISNAEKTVEQYEAEYNELNK
jgi:hypothetical protein